MGLSERWCEQQEEEKRLREEDTRQAAATMLSPDRSPRRLSFAIKIVEAKVGSAAKSAVVIYRLNQGLGQLLVLTG